MTIKAQKATKPDLRRDLLAVLRKHFGKRDADREGINPCEAFDHAVEFLRGRYLALPHPGDSYHNCGSPIHWELIDGHGMRVDLDELNVNGRYDALYQLGNLIEEIEELDVGASASPGHARRT